MNVTRISRQASELWSKLKQYFQNLNFFPSVPPSTDEHELCTQRISTRLFIILLIMSMTILLLYTSLIKVRITAKVDTPTLAQYSDLYSTYSQALICPCSNISINYDKFLHVEYTLHQVCSSVFVNQSWIDYLASLVRTKSIYTDFRDRSSSSFQALRSFCELTNRTISDGLIRFYSNRYISALVKSERLLESEINASVVHFRLSLMNSFLSARLMIRDTTQANALLSALKTNYVLYHAGAPDLVLSATMVYSRNCSCGSSSTCSQPAFIDNIAMIPDFFDVPGLFLGCSMIEALLPSTLECFYRQPCIDQLQSYLNISSRMNVIALDASLPSQYIENTTIEELVNSLMIEQWNLSTTYEKYYNECRPLQCTYILETRNNVVYIITTLFGIVGGLTTTLKFILPRLIKLIRKKRQQQQQPTTGERTFRNSILRLSIKLNEYGRTLNIFPSVPPSTDEYELRTQRISTRLFIVLLFISITILLLYNSLIVKTKTFKFNTPSFGEYSNLYSKYSQTLTCPCANISINYDNFLHVEYTLHEVCNSTFIDPSWIEYFRTDDFFQLHQYDFRVIGPSAFQALRTFCHLINRTISDSLIFFHANQYVGAAVISSEQYDLETKILINQFRSSIESRFSLSLLMIREITQTNALYSALATNYRSVITKNNDLLTVPQIYYGCNCDALSNCTISSGMFDNDIFTKRLFNVSGFYTGCYVIEALLHSTLECFYSQPCIDQLQNYANKSSRKNFTALDASLPSQYTENTTIEELVNSLMIEQWNLSATYEKYYNECRPIQCNYILETRNNAIYIVTILFGIVGGLTTTLKFILPRLIKLIRKKRQQQQPTTGERTVRNSILRLSTKLNEYRRTLNIFPSVPPSTDEYELRTQRISTRLFIILLFISITILLLYNSLIVETKTFKVNTPSFGEYSNLYSKYSQTLICPCSKITINYGIFLQVEYTLHQVCNSSFVHYDWIHYLAEDLNILYFKTNDFRRTGHSVFQGLKTFCDLTDRTISDNLILFYANQYVSAAVISQDHFNSETELLINQSRSSMTSSFALSLSMIRETTQADALFSGHKSNYNPHIIGTTIHLAIVAETYNGCSCASSSTCIQPSSIYNDDASISLFDVPGFYTGCYVIESLLRSTLECFYNQQCINKLQRYIDSWPPLTTDITALDESLPSEYHINSTIQDLVDKLMIEQWNPSTVYEQYYNECNVTYCSYTLDAKNDLIYIFTTLFGIAGGLITVLKLIAPRLTKFIMYYIQQRRPTVVPENPAIRT